MGKLSSEVSLVCNLLCFQSTTDFVRNALLFSKTRGGKSSMLWNSRLKLSQPNASFSKTLIALLRASLLSTLCTAATVAQSPTTGRIAGTLKDPNGARIVGAQVIITSNATAEQRRVTSDDQGNYSASLLSPGTYVVRIAARGFAPALFTPVPVIITETT